MTDRDDHAGRDDRSRADRGTAPLHTDGGTVATTEHSRTWRRPTAFYNHATKYAVYLLVAGFVVWSVWEIRVSVERLLVGYDQLAWLLGSMWPPELGVRASTATVEVAGLTVERPAVELTPDGERIRTGVVESLAMAFVATGVGVAISIPVAFMAAENLVSRPVYAIGRSIVSLSRAFHELVVAIVVVKAFGFGALSGAIALVFATPGFFAKLLAEELEDIDEGQMEAIEATGAARSQVWLYGVLPQAIPRIIGLAVYRWDINIRASTVIGIVGAGGIGITLVNAFDRYEYDFAAGIILVIVALVLVGEVASWYARRRVQ